MELEAIANRIDHALLHPTLTDAELRDGCAAAVRAGVACVCVKPFHVPLAAEALASGSRTVVGTVVGFPHGANPIAVKCFETEHAAARGAREIDAVVNIGKVLSEDWEYLHSEIAALTAACRDLRVTLKVILESGYLPSTPLKVRLCEMCADLGAQYVKTSTGFGFTRTSTGSYEPFGATDDDIKLMVATVGARARVKASGGIRSLDDFLRVVRLGAHRVGTSATVAILREARERATAAAAIG